MTRHSNTPDSPDTPDNEHIITPDPDASEYEYDVGDQVCIDRPDPDPTDYYVVTSRLWDYDPTPDRGQPLTIDHRSYHVQQIVTMGGDDYVVSEDDLAAHFCRVSDSDVQQAIDRHGSNGGDDT